MPFWAYSVYIGVLDLNGKAARIKDHV